MVELIEEWNLDYIPQKNKFNVIAKNLTPVKLA